MESRYAVVICGYPASGKSTLVEEYNKDNFIRLNRDTLGGTLKDVAKKFSEILKVDKVNSFVFDNTYATREARTEIAFLAKREGLITQCIWLQTSIEDAQFNAALRMYRKYGRLLSPEEMKKSKDPNAFPPMVQFKYRKDFQEPSVNEGWDKIIYHPFNRKQEKGYANKALILDYDGTLRVTKSGNNFPLTPDDIEILPGRRERLDKAIRDGYILIGISNQSGVHKGELTLEAAKDCFDKTNALLGGVSIPVLFCPHQSNPISCYCRKPMPGNGVLAIEKFKLDRSQTIFVGDLTTDETFAKRCGFQFIHADKFF